MSTYSCVSLHPQSQYNKALNAGQKEFNTPTLAHLGRYAYQHSLWKMG